MRFHLHRHLEDPIGKSLFGDFQGIDNGFHAHSVEREWKDNLAGKSCVPDGFYALEPHNGTKYKDTFALIGEHVSHSKTKGIARYACVVHRSTTGKGLQGCVSLAMQIGWSAGSPPRLVSSMVGDFTALLASKKETHYLLITSALGSDLSVSNRNRG